MFKCLEQFRIKLAYPYVESTTWIFLIVWWWFCLRVLLYGGFSPSPPPPFFFVCCGLFVSSNTQNRSILRNCLSIVYIAEQCWGFFLPCLKIYSYSLILKLLDFWGRKKFERQLYTEFRHLFCLLIKSFRSLLNPAI